MGFKTACANSLGTSTHTLSRMVRRASGQGKQKLLKEATESAGVSPSTSFLIRSTYGMYPVVHTFVDPSLPEEEGQALTCSFTKIKTYIGYSNLLLYKLVIHIINMVTITRLYANSYILLELSVGKV